MPGPPPKPSALRQRTNKASTKATLPPEGSDELEDRKIPTLPDRPCTGWPSEKGVGGGPCGLGLPAKTCAYCDSTGVLSWGPLAVDFWEAVWRSPMSAEFVQADIPGLYILADLTDRYWRGESSLAAEIRLQRQQYGLDSLARRRLQWEVGKVENAKRRAPAATLAQPTRKTDPRQVLRAVK